MICTEKVRISGTEFELTINIALIEQSLQFMQFVECFLFIIL